MLINYDRNRALTVDQKLQSLIESIQRALDEAKDKTIFGKLAFEDEDATAGVLVVDKSTAFNTMPQTISNSKITSDMVAVKAELSNPAAQTSDWTVTTANGSLSVSGSISGSTKIKLYLLKQQ